MKYVRIPIKISDNYDKSWNLPTYSHEYDAGFDLRASFLEEYRIIEFGTSLIIPTGVSVDIPDDYQIEIRSRSGLAAKDGVYVLNSPGTIDSGYHGEICVILAKATFGKYEIKRGDRIAQAVVMPAHHAIFSQVDAFEESVRGSGGFGSTGV